MVTVKDYKILKAHDSGYLEIQVRAYLDKGYEALGGVSVSSGPYFFTYVQAVILYTNNDSRQY